MDKFQIFGVILGALIVILCALYARTKHAGYNNLFSMFLLFCGSIALSALTIIYPSWWMVAIMSYALFAVWFHCCIDYNNKRNQLSHAFRVSRIRNLLRNSTDWIIMIVLLIISLNVIITYWSWYIGIVFIPMAALTAFLVLAKIHKVLSRI